MARKEVKGPITDNALNVLNHNLIELYNMRNVLQTQINDLVLDSGESNQEVAQARGGHKVLSDRLNETDSQLAETEQVLNDTKNKTTNNEQQINDTKSRVSDLENQVGLESIKLGNWKIERNNNLNSLDFRVM